LGVLCFQVEAYTTGRSPVRRYPTERDTKTSTMRKPTTNRAVEPWNKNVPEVPLHLHRHSHGIKKIQRQRNQRDMSFVHLTRCATEIFLTSV